MGYWPEPEPADEFMQSGRAARVAAQESPHQASLLVPDKCAHGCNSIDVAVREKTASWHQRARVHVVEPRGGGGGARAKTRSSARGTAAGSARRAAAAVATVPGQAATWRRAHWRHEEVSKHRKGNSATTCRHTPCRAPHPDSACSAQSGDTHGRHDPDLAPVQA